MRRAILLHVLRRTWHERARLWIVLALVAPRLLAGALGRDGRLPEEGLAILLGMTLSSGLVGRDLVDGTARLAFTRPVSRSDYVLWSWLAAVSATGLALALVSGGICLVAWLDPIASPATWSEIARVAIGQAAAAAGTCAIVILACTVARGHVGLAVHVVALLASGILLDLSRSASWSLGQRAGRLLADLLVPRLEVGSWPLAGPFPWQGLAGLAALSGAYLLAATWVTNRAEIRS